jgi:hypothetical protein
MRSEYGSLEPLPCPVKTGIVRPKARHADVAARWISGRRRVPFARQLFDSGTG